MADHSTSNQETAMDYAEHEATYAGFIAATKYITAALVVLLILMAAFLIH